MSEPVHAVAPNDLRLIALLSDAGLPTTDLAEGTAEYVALGSPPLAFGGIVYCGSAALLRSIVVANAARKTGKGAAVVAELLSRARARGVNDVWLLTETAEPFFATQGFARRPRSEAPGGVRETSQFAHLCPDSAVLMHRSLS